MMYAGLEAYSVGRLQWRLIDREHGIVRLEPGTTKNDSARIFPFGELLPELCDVMNRQWEVTKQIEQERDQ